MMKCLVLTTVIVLLALTGSAHAQQLTLKVVSIADGDTFTGLDRQNRKVKVRLHGIDAPETGQAFGTVSRKALGDLIQGKTVEIEEIDRTATAESSPRFISAAST